MLTKLNIPPGIYRNNTEYATGPRWYDGNLVRWYGGALGPVGGWERMTAVQLTGACRGVFAWLDNSENRYLALGTSTNLYVYNDGTLTDITPADLVAGRDYTILGFGYGAGNYGAEEYGTERTTPSALTLQASTWSFDSWGEYLVGCSTADGRVLEWLLDKTSDAAVTSNAPTDCTGIIVTEQRHLMAYGAGGDKRLIKWSDSEDREDWTPTTANQSGDWNLNTPGEIRRIVKARGELLILTTEDVHVARFIGSPLVFSFERVGDKCGIISPNAVASVNDGAIWMGMDAKIYAYDGAVRQVPCEVESWLEESLYKLGGEQIYAGTLAEFGEVWWFFPAAYNEENSRYVVYNYKQNHWAIGTLARSAFLDRGAWSHPVGVLSYIYQHEQGTTDSGATRNGSIYAETGAIEIDSGDRVAHITQVLPDEQTQGEVTCTFKSRYTPTGTESVHGPYTVRSDGYTDVRFSGRQIRYRVDQASDVDWRVGNFRLNVAPGESR